MIFLYILHGVQVIEKIKIPLTWEVRGVGIGLKALKRNKQLYGRGLLGLRFGKVVMTSAYNGCSIYSFIQKLFIDWIVLFLILFMIAIKFFKAETASWKTSQSER